MSDDERAERDTYYRNAASWADDRVGELRASRRIAWWVAAAAITVAVLEALALVFLAPLKTVVPYTLLVDRQTGYVQKLDPVNGEKIAPDTALTRSFLVQYVIAREGFDIDALNDNYRKVALWSSGAARAQYIAGMQASSPTSPLSRYPRSSVVDVTVKSISALRDNAALVRFDTRRRDADGHAAAARAWVAVVRYRFSTEPLSAADRLVNPLGFQVLRYDASEETLPPPQAVVVTPGAVPGATLPASGAVVVPVVTATQTSVP